MGRTVIRFKYRVSVKAMIIVDSRLRDNIRAASRVNFIIMYKFRVIISLRARARAVNRYRVSVELGL